MQVWMWRKMASKLRIQNYLDELQIQSEKIRYFSIEDSHCTQINMRWKQLSDGQPYGNRMVVVLYNITMKDKHNTNIYERGM